MPKKINEAEFVAHFLELGMDDVARAGGKGAQLGEMFNAGLPVPPGFVVLTASFDMFMHDNNLDSKIYKLIEKVNEKDTHELERVSKEIKEMILAAKIPSSVEKSVHDEFKKLKAEFVAVRSSATAEDASTASWAGELDTFTNITFDSLVHSVRKCWASLFSPRAIFYRIEKNLRHEEVSVGVVVQKMIQSEIAGVAFTVHPVTKDFGKIVIEGAWGLGESVVSGSVTPDNYIVDKNGWFIDSIEVASQEHMLTKVEGKTTKIQVPEHKKEMQKLSGQQIIELAKMCKKIEEYYKHPQDIEWALEANKLYLLQTRPITTLK